MPSEYRPRLSIDITYEQREELDRILAHHGLQKAVFSIIIDDLINAVNKNGYAVIAGILSRSLTLGDITKEAQ